MKKVLAQLIFLLIIFPAFSQKNSPLPGYIVTESNDTLLGNTKIQNATGYLKKVKLYDLSNKENESYRADKIKGFCYDNRIFQSLKWEGSHYFFEKITGGPIILYTSTYSMPGGGGGGIPYSTSYSTEYFILKNSSFSSIEKEAILENL